MKSSRTQIISTDIVDCNCVGTENAKSPDSGAVYLAAPIPTYCSRRYGVAVAAIERRHPRQEILLPHCLWSDNQHWLATFKDMLAPVSTLYVLADEDGFVGKGVWEEVAYLRRSRTQLAAFAFGPRFVVSPQWRLSLWGWGRDWSHYASLTVLTGHETGHSCGRGGARDE